MRSLVFSALLLVGCAHNPAIRTRIVDAPVVTVEKCVKAADVPTRPTRLGEAPDNLETALSVALAKVSEWVRYGNKADEVLKNCT